MLKLAFPVLLKVTVCAALAVPRVCVAKPTFVEDKLTIGAGATPVPLSRICIGLGERPFAIVRFAVRPPSAAGVKVTWITQLAPADKLPTQLVVSAKSEASVPPLVMLETASAEDRLLVSVTL